MEEIRAQLAERRKRLEQTVDSPPENALKKEKKKETETVGNATKKDWTCEVCDTANLESAFLCSLCNGARFAQPKKKKVELDAQTQKTLERKYFYSGDVTDQEKENDSDSEEGVRAPMPAQFSRLREFGPGFEEIEEEESEEEEIALDGNVNDLFQVYQNAPKTDQHTRQLLSYSFKGELLKQKSRHQARLSRDHWKILKNIEIDTNNKRTLLFTLGFGFTAIKEACANFFANCLKKSAASAKSDDYFKRAGEKVARCIAEFADSSVDFKLWRKDTPKQNITFFDDCSLSIGKFLVTPRKLTTNGFLFTLYETHPILILAYPWKTLLDIIIKCSQWDYKINDIFPYDLLAPNQVMPVHCAVEDMITDCSIFDLLARRFARDTVKRSGKDMKLDYPLKRKNAQYIASEVMSLLEREGFTLVPSNLQNRYVCKKQIVLKIFNKVVKTENQLVAGLKVIEKQPPWLINLAVEQARGIEHKPPSPVRKLKRKSKYTTKPRKKMKRNRRNG